MKRLYLFVSASPLLLGTVAFHTPTSPPPTTKLEHRNDIVDISTRRSFFSRSLLVAGTATTLLNPSITHAATPTPTTTTTTMMTRLYYSKISTMDSELISPRRGNGRNKPYPDVVGRSSSPTRRRRIPRPGLRKRWDMWHTHPCGMILRIYPPLAASTRSGRPRYCPRSWRGGMDRRRS